MKLYTRKIGPWTPGPWAGHQTSDPRAGTSGRTPDPEHLIKTLDPGHPGRDRDPTPLDRTQSFRLCGRTWEQQLLNYHYRYNFCLH